jgi:hypothetical protein
MVNSFGRHPLRGQRIACRNVMASLIPTSRSAKQVLTNASQSSKTFLGNGFA